jgi:hypothetical protein
MSPFLAICAREVSGKPRKHVADNMQKLAAENFRNSRFVSWGLEISMSDIHAFMLLDYKGIGLIVNPVWIF